MLGGSEILLVNAVDHKTGASLPDGLPLCVVDVDGSVVEAMRPYSEEEDGEVMHFEENPTDIPVASELVAKTFTWLRDVYHGDPPYEATPEVAAESEEQVEPKAAPKAARANQR